MPGDGQKEPAGLHAGRSLQHQDGKTQVGSQGAETLYGTEHGQVPGGSPVGLDLGFSQRQLVCADHRA